MHILLVTPARQGRLAGNQITARRWCKILRSLGHEVVVADRFSDQRTDLLLAMHAYRSADSIERFRHLHPSHPMVVALTGTDIHGFLKSDPERTTRSLEVANRLVVLNSLAWRTLPASARAKTFLVYEGAEPLPRARRPSRRHFEVCVIGHLREEKDPLRAALAVRDLPDTSRIRVRHYGGCYSNQWADRARREMACNPRYRWYGEVPHWRVRRALSTCRVTVLSSRIEGGANVLSEAIVAGVPVLSSDIDGSVGILGQDYAGYFPVGDTAALRACLIRAEQDPAFVRRLEEQVAHLAPRFTIAAETSRWRELLDEAPRWRPGS